MVQLAIIEPARAQVKCQLPAKNEMIWIKLDRTAAIAGISRRLPVARPLQPAGCDFP
jgi:hypothetical protein